MDDEAAGGRAEGKSDSPGKSSKLDLIDILMAVMAAAALVVSIVGLEWSKQSAAAAKQSAAAAQQANRLTEQADRSAARATVMAQAREISFSFQHVTNNQGGVTWYVQVINLSTNNIRNVYLVISLPSGFTDYVEIGVVNPCAEWQALDTLPYTSQLYFEDQAGQYWELDKSGNLLAQASSPDMTRDFNVTDGWHSSETMLACPG